MIRRDHVPPAQAPPRPVEQVPLLVAMGFDDNGFSGLPGSGGTGGLSWVTRTFDARINADGSPARASFFMTSSYVATSESEDARYVKQAWRAAMEEGHDIGDHTHSHPHGDAFTTDQWRKEIGTCLSWLTQPGHGIGVPRDQIVGFRTPFVEYNDSTFVALEDLGFQYDASIEDGFQDDHDGTNYHWPYTLDHGSPGHEVMVAWGLKKPITAHPGLWEMPLHPVIVPPDAACARYGVPPGLRARMKAAQSYFDTQSGKITGADYNLWVMFGMTKAEFLATLKYTLDLRLKGNRAPFMFAGHSDIYASKYTEPMMASLKERQEALEEFLDYALSHPIVRVVSIKSALAWIRGQSTSSGPTTKRAFGRKI